MEQINPYTVFMDPLFYAKNNRVCVNCPWINKDGYYVPGFFQAITQNYIVVDLREADGIGDNEISLPKELFYDSSRYEFYKNMIGQNWDVWSWYSEVGIDLNQEADVSWSSIPNLYTVKNFEPENKSDLAILRFELFV